MTRDDTRPERTAEASADPFWPHAAYLLIGVFFGVVLIKSEAVSWFRIQEMFRFQGFHMYGLLMTAVATSALSIAALRALDVRSLAGRAIHLAAKPWQPGERRRYLFGGTLFGLGWGLTGACPGPIYALLGYGVWGAAIVLLAALAGARVYAALEPRLPH